MTPKSLQRGQQQMYQPLDRSAWLKGTAKLLTRSTLLAMMCSLTDRPPICFCTRSTAPFMHSMLVCCTLSYSHGAERKRQTSEDASKTKMMTSYASTSLQSLVTFEPTSCNVMPTVEPFFVKVCRLGELKDLSLAPSVELKSCRWKMLETPDRGVPSHVLAESYQ